MATERAPIETLDPRLQMVLEWFTPGPTLGLVQTYIRFHLGQVYEILQGERVVGEEKSRLMEDAKVMLEEVIETYYSPGSGIAKLAAKYAIEGEARLADVLLGDRDDNFARPSKAMARLTHLADKKERYDEDPREGYRMRSALILLAQEIVARRQPSA